jgi:sulfoquinovose isomerase
MTVDRSLPIRTSGEASRGPSAENEHRARTILDSSEHRAVLADQISGLMTFGRRARLSGGGFGWLDANGDPTPGKPKFLYVTCRMTHVFSLGVLLGVSGAEQMVDHGLAALTGDFYDATHGGWYAALGDNNEIRDSNKSAYPHSFVILAAASATMAGIPKARRLLDEALEVSDKWFWDDNAGMVVESWDRTFEFLDEYRGANANMHTVEAYMAAYAATGSALWLERALRICDRIIEVCRERSWRLPEHYDRSWNPLLEHNRNRPDDPFHPYGSTIGHGLEWSRLLIQLRAGLNSAGFGDHPQLLDSAIALFNRAVEDGWAVDGADGFVYTVGWEGKPVIRQRLHWVLCEGLGAAAALSKATGEVIYADWYSTWWEFAQKHHIDGEAGSWHHELDSQNRPSATIRDGKADIYHAIQAMLSPQVNLGPSFASELSQQVQQSNSGDQVAVEPAAAGVSRAERP